MLLNVFPPKRKFQNIKNIKINSEMSYEPRKIMLINPNIYLKEASYVKH